MSEPVASQSVYLGSVTMAVVVAVVVAVIEVAADLAAGELLAVHVKEVTGGVMD